MLAGFRNARINIELAVRFDDPFRMGFCHMIARQIGRVGICCRAERIEPGMELHAPAVGGTDHIFQRIIARILALRAGQYLGPRNQHRRIQAVAGGSYLHEYGIEAGALQLVQQGVEFLLLLGLIAC
ncbi:hypothetical protein D3C85_1406770 [compost metagenome]